MFTIWTQFANKTQTNPGYNRRKILQGAIAANPYTNRVTTDYRLRTILFAVPGTMSNIIFAAFNGVVGFLFLAVVLAGAVILLENSQGGKNYPGFTIYAVAAYTFYKIIMSTIQVIKVGKRKSPLLSITRRIGYVDACVSILTLQTAMFASFAQGEEALAKQMNGITGAVVCLMVFGLGIQGIWTANIRKKELLAGGNRND